MNQLISVPKVAGRKSRGVRRNALFAIPTNAASCCPARNCRIGFRAHTYPVTRENIDTPIRPCTRIRIIGNWRNRGETPVSADTGLKRSSSNPLAMCVQTTRSDAMPRRPCCENLVSPKLSSFWRPKRLERERHEPSRGKKAYIDPFHVLMPNGAHSANANANDASYISSTRS